MSDPFPMRLKVESEQAAPVRAGDDALLTDREPNLCPYCDNPEIGQHVCPPTRVELAFLRRHRDPERAAKWASAVRKRWAASPAGLLAMRRMKEGTR